MFFLMHSQQAADSTLRLAAAGILLLVAFPGQGWAELQLSIQSTGEGISSENNNFISRRRTKVTGTSHACRAEEERPPVSAGGLAPRLWQRATKQPLGVFPGKKDARARREGGGEFLYARRGSHGPWAGISAL